jgi:hypothetical protein
MASREERRAELEAMVQTEDGQYRVFLIYAKYYHGMQDNGLWDGRVFPVLSDAQLIELIIKWEFRDAGSDA